MEDEVYSTIMPIPEPERSIALKAMEAEAEDSQIDGIDKITAEDLMKRYEDLREYEETCFWDIDFDMLNYLDEEALRSSETAKFMGIGERQDRKIIQFPGKGDGKDLNVELNIAPWDMEDDEE